MKEQIKAAIVESFVVTLGFFLINLGNALNVISTQNQSKIDKE